ncbi:MAG: PQQ-dependent sugar dehydrogenase [Legionellales bacterium]|nr:PQQ-dependent sugar dehydrogenase [Legionellales bacterium]
MALGKNGVVFVGTTGVGKVYALIPNQQFTQAKKTLVIAEKLRAPNGVAVLDDNLYVAETQRILRFDNITEHLEHPPKPKTVYDHLPDKDWHGNRVIHFGPEGKLYISIGMPCNTCDYRGKDDRFGTIMRLSPNGNDAEIFAKGIRNSMGFDWQPETNVLWFSDNGQDMLGDNIPPEEINRAPHAGMDFGFPYFYDNNHPYPNYEKHSPDGITPTTYDIQAHSAPLGIEFYRGNLFPTSYHHQLFVAEHGSWNRSQKVGYQVVMLKIDGDKVVAKENFATGWLQGQTVWGRPVDILTLPDGALLVSDDYAGVVYRITYTAS